MWTGGIFYFPWHRHQIEGTNGFYCLVRKTLAKRGKRNCQSSEAKCFCRSETRTTTVRSPVDTLTHSATAPPSLGRPTLSICRGGGGHNRMVRHVCTPVYRPRGIISGFEIVLHCVILPPFGSFRVNSTNGSQVSVSNIAHKIPKITLVSIMKACQILGCNSKHFWRYSLSNFLFCFAFLPSRL